MIVEQLSREPDMSIRGLVVTLPIQVSTTGFSIPNGFDPTELRSWLLHWDKLDFPVSQITSFHESPEVDYLMSCGIMQQTLASDAYLQSDKAHPNDRGYYLSTIDSYRVLDQKEPGIWALAFSKFNTIHPRQPSFAFRSDVREDSGFFDEDGDDSTGRSLLCRIVGSLPTPEHDVPLEDILSFKRKRQSELLALRHHIEELTQSIALSPDKPLAEVSGLERLKSSIAEAAKTTKEAPFAFRWIDLDMRINLPVAAYVVSQGIDISLAELAGAAACIIGPSLSLRERRSSTSPFEYVVAYTREFDLPGR